MRSADHGVKNSVGCRTVKGKSDAPARISNQNVLICYLITRYCLRISTVFSMGRASTVWPLAVVVVALNMEL
jgi:hypothetical protein